MHTDLFLNILEHVSPFCETTYTPVFHFWWRLLYVWKPEWATLFLFGKGIFVTHSPQLTPGVIPANLLMASKAAKPFSSIYLTRHWWGIKVGSIVSLLPHSVRPGSLRTELRRLGSCMQIMICQYTLNIDKVHDHGVIIGRFYIMTMIWWNWPKVYVDLDLNHAHITFQGHTYIDVYTDDYWLTVLTKS